MWWRHSQRSDVQNSGIDSLKGRVRKNRFAWMNRTSYHYFCNGKFRLSKTRALASKTYEGEALMFIIKSAHIVFLHMKMQYWIAENILLKEIKKTPPSTSPSRNLLEWLLFLFRLVRPRPLSCLKFSPPPFLLFVWMYESYYGEKHVNIN